MININSGQDRILELCRPLRDYTTFVESFHRYRTRNDISDREAAGMAIADLQPGAVSGYLQAHESEVLDMLLTEYDEEKTLKAIYYEGERAGLQRARELIDAKDAEIDAKDAGIERLKAQLAAGTR